MNAWELRGLTKRFGGAFTPTTTAVDAVDIDVAEGERVALIGESGSGKTTLARCGLGLSGRDGGRVALFGEDTARWGSRRWHAERRRVQLLFQDPRAMLHPRLSISALLHESCVIHRPDRDPTAEVAALLDAIGLGGRGHALPHELSGGEQRRAGLARVLLARPRLLVADEPTAGLDAAMKAELIELIVERVGSECAVVLISHDLPVVAWACHRVLVMQRGRIVDGFSASWLHDLREGKANIDGRHPYTVRLLAAAGMSGVAA